MNFTMLSTQMSEHLTSASPVLNPICGESTVFSSANKGLLFDGGSSSKTSSPAQHSFPDSNEHGFFVDDFALRRVDDDGANFHRGDFLLTNQFLCFRVQCHVYRDYVALFEKSINVSVFERARSRTNSILRSNAYVSGQ